MPDRKLRITFVTERPGLSGGARVIADYAVALLDNGHDVRVFAQPVPTPTLKQKLRAVVTGKPAQPARHASPFFEKLGERFQRLPAAGPARAADLPDADIIVANFWTTAGPVAARPSSNGVKLYFMDVYGAEGQPIDDVRKTWRLGLKTITVNTTLKAQVEAASGEFVRVVSCGVDPLFVRNQPRAFRQRPPTAGFVFSNNAMKGSRHCIEAIEKARLRIPELRAVAFGPSAPGASMSPLPAAISFRSQVTDLEAKTIYESADFWLFGSINEGFGLPILEAMASGTPVIASRAAAAPDILSTGGGYLVDPGIADQMAAKMVEICALDAQQWVDLSNAARATAERFSLESARRNFEAALIDADEDRWALRDPAVTTLAVL